MRRFSAIVFLAMGGCVLGMLAIVLGDETRSAPYEEIRKQLDAETEIDSVGKPLSNVAKDLADYHGIPIVVDKDAMDDGAGGDDPSVTVRIDGVSLRSGLDILARRLRLAWIIRNGQIIITSREPGGHKLRTVAYDVTDLALDDDARVTTLEKILTRTVLPESWAPAQQEAGEETGGLAGKAPLRAKSKLARGKGKLTMEKVAGRLIFSVAQTESVHWQIERLLRDLRSLQKDTPLAREQAAVEMTRAKIFIALTMPTQVDFQETPLSEVLDYLKDSHGIEIEINREALDDCRIATDSPVTYSREDASLDAVLTEILEPLYLTWVVRDESLLITTNEDAQDFLTTVVYDLSGMFGQDKATANELARSGQEEDATGELTRFGQLVVAAIVPTSWSESGRLGRPDRRGRLEPFSAPKRCALVVAQNEAVHAEIRCLLRDLARIKRGGAGDVSVTYPSDYPPIKAALKTPVRWAFQETPLKDVLEQIERDTKLTIRVDPEVLEASVCEASDPAGESVESGQPRLSRPVSLAIDDLPLQNALEHLLGMCGLTWIVRNDELTVVTPDRAEDYLETAVYDVCDLSPPEWSWGNGQQSIADLESFANDTAEILARFTGYPVGNRSAIAPFVSNGMRVLVVRQTQAGHRRLERFLADLRRLPRANRDPSDTVESKDVLQRANYRLRKALNAPITARFDHVPLRQVLSHLEKASAVKFVLDEVLLESRSAVEQVAKPIDWQQHVSANLERVSLRRALDVVLQSTGLSWRSTWGAIRIGDSKQIAEDLPIRLHDVSGIYGVRGDNGDPIPDLPGLCARVRASVDPASWEEMGGVACCVKIHLGAIYALAIVQTEANHENVAKLLEELYQANLKLTQEDLRRLPPMHPGEDEEEAALDEIALDEEAIPDAPPDSLTDDVQWKQAAAGNTAFAMDLYKQLAAKENGNIFFSPWSISTAMAMAYAGARGDTAAEMGKTMHFTLSADELHPAMAALAASVGRDARLHRYSLLTANRLWAQQDWPLLEEFTGVLKEQYGAEAGRVDFSKPEEAAREINAWVARQTAGKLPTAIDPAAISDDMRLALANAVSFKARWEEPFKPDLTLPLSFYAESRPVDVRTMFLVAEHRYAQVGDLQILEKPYLGRTLSMLILLPAKESGALERLEKSLSAENLEKWCSRLAPREVLLYLPRFRCQMSCSLANTLANMGICSAFDPDGHADFSGMSGARETYLHEVFHSAQINVVESGTIAVAATMVMGGGMGGVEESPKPVIFRADHPFLYLIRDNRTGSILFMGRLSSPEEK